MLKEAVRMVLYYLMLPSYIQALEARLRIISPRYYAEHSFMGSGVQMVDSEAYQKALTPQHAVLDIVSDESAVIRRIDRLNFRFNLFSEVFTAEEIERLKMDLYADLVLLVRACQQVEEVEYFLNERRQQVKNEIAMDTVSAQELERLDEMEIELFSMFGV